MGTNRSRGQVQRGRSEPVTFACVWRNGCANRFEMGRRSTIWQSENILVCGVCGSRECASGFKLCSDAKWAPLMSQKEFKKSGFKYEKEKR